MQFFQYMYSNTDFLFGNEARLFWKLDFTLKSEYIRRTLCVLRIFSHFNNSDAYSRIESGHNKVDIFAYTTNRKHTNRKMVDRKYFFSWFEHVSIKRVHTYSIPPSPPSRHSYRTVLQADRQDDKKKTYFHFVMDKIIE